MIDLNARQIAILIIRVQFQGMARVIVDDQSRAFLIYICGNDGSNDADGADRMVENKPGIGRTWK